MVQNENNAQAKASELTQSLAAEGYYEVVEGYEAVKKMIEEKAGNNTELLCSGYRVFPDGTKCNGCADCEGR